MQRMRVTLSDALAAAVLAQARAEGNAIGNDRGAGTIIRRAVRAHLNRSGWHAAELDVTDEEFARLGFGQREAT